MKDSGSVGLPGSATEASATLARSLVDSRRVGPFSYALSLPAGPDSHATPSEVGKTPTGAEQGAVCIQLSDADATLVKEFLKLTFFENKRKLFILLMIGEKHLR